jgi:hypothetical protein
VIPPCIFCSLSLDLSFDFTVQFLLPYSNIGRANVVYSFIYVPFWTSFGLNVSAIVGIYLDSGHKYKRQAGPEASR